MRIREIATITLAASIACAQAAGAPGTIANPHATPKPNLSMSTGGSGSRLTAAKPAGNMTHVRGCNQDGEDIVVGVIYLPKGSDNLWRSQGWYSIKAGQCRDLFDTDRSKFYLRAEEANGGGGTWGSDTNSCATYPGPYDFNLEGGHNDDPCPDGTDLVGFVQVTDASVGTFTYTFKP